MKIKTKDLYNNNVLSGHSNHKFHPSMKHITNVHKNYRMIKQNVFDNNHSTALNKIIQVKKNNGSIMIFSDRKFLHDIIKDFANKHGFHYLVSVWINGLFTNDVSFHNTLTRMNQLRKQLERDINRKTAIIIKRYLNRKERKLKGLLNMFKRPDLIIILGAESIYNILKESKKMNVKTIAICDTNIDKDLIDYPIYGNDDSIFALKTIIDSVDKNILKYEQK